MYMQPSIKPHLHVYLYIHVNVLVHVIDLNQPIRIHVGVHVYVRRPTLVTRSLYVSLGQNRHCTGEKM